MTKKTQPSAMIGFGTLTCAKDLRAKLEHDFLVLQEAPANTYAAFNFFVTAEHMLDWLYPGDRSSQDIERQREVLLRIVSNIANGAKHFKPYPKLHDSVTHVDHSAYGQGPYGAGPYGGDLIVTLDGDAATKYGPSISILALAQHVLDYWKSHPDPSLR